VPAESDRPEDRAGVLEHSQWPMVQLVAETIVAAVNAAGSGSYVEVDVPFKEYSYAHPRTSSETNLYSMSV
jgi:hypothetical protein